EDERAGHRRVRERGPSAGSARGGGQRILLAVLTAADRARGGYRGALDDEVSQRTLGFRRRRVDLQLRRDRGEDRIPAERDRRNSFSIRLLSRAARREDSGGAHEASRGERHRHGQLPQPSSKSEENLLPGSAQSSAARAGEAPDERFRRDDFLRAGLEGERGEVPQPRATLL